MGRGKGISTPQPKSKVFSFSPDDFSKAILQDLGESKSGDEVAQYIEDTSDNSAIPWYVMPEIEKHWRDGLRATSENGESIHYQLVELDLQKLEGCYGGVNQEWVDGYVQRPNPPAIVFRQSDEGIQIFDGGHRTKAALTRGDESIRAWVPHTVCHA